MGKVLKKLDLSARHSKVPTFHFNFVVLCVIVQKALLEFQYIVIVLKLIFMYVNSSLPLRLLYCGVVCMYILWSI
jgi:hypothetical protein